MEAMVSLAEQVRSLNWVHTIDLGGGLVTPGAWPPSPLIRRALDDIDFRGRKVLDIGCWDGLWSFEAEKRGASLVYATDSVSQRPHREQPTFELARRILDSRVRYYPDLSVYHVEQLGIADFDVVLFCGVYYHLKNPLLALARLRQVMKPGGLLVIEGEAINDYRNCEARFFYRQAYRGDRSTWWIPTGACLRQWVECSYFQIVNEYNVARDALSGHRGDRLRKFIKRFLGRRAEFSRLLLIARAVSRVDENYPYPEEDLSRFFC